MLFHKQRVTIWPNGQTQTIPYDPIPTDTVDADMGAERESHSFLPSTVSIEEIHRTLVITKESGTVHVYTWS